MSRIESKVEKVEGWIKKTEKEEQIEERASSRDGERSINSIGNMRSNSSGKSEEEVRGVV